MGSPHEDYQDLLDRYIRGEFSVQEFQTRYLNRFKNEDRQLDDELFAILDELFGDVDAFSGDPMVRVELQSKTPGFYLDENQLRERVIRASREIGRLLRALRD